MFNKALWGTLAMLAALAVPICPVQAAGSSSLDEVQSTVMAMLESEAKIAAIEQAQRERKTLGQPLANIAPSLSVGSQQPLMTPPEVPARPEPEQPKVRDAQVLGIFGLGQNLMATVRIDGQTLRFQRGSRYPAGYGADSPYTLIAIKTPCVKFAEKGVAQTLCIDGLPSQ